MLKFGRMRMVALTAILLLLLGLAPVSAQSIPRRYIGNAVATKLTVNTTSTLTGDVTSAANVTVGTNLILAGQTAATATNGMTLSPTGSYQPLTAAGAVGFGAITVGTAGSVLTLVNTANQTITITDTGTLKLTANIALGQYDSLTLISDGTNWIQLATANN